MNKSDGGNGGYDRAAIQRQVDRLVKARIAEMMAAAGLESGRIGLEVVWNMPPDFVRCYEGLWMLMMEGDDGGLGSTGGLGGAGGRARREAEVGVAKDPLPGRMGGGAQGRTRDTGKSRATNGVVVVRSGGSARRGVRGVGGSRPPGGMAAHGVEDFARLRERIDKRLRQLGRDIRDEIEDLTGLDLLTGETRVVVDVDKVGQMREALSRATRAASLGEIATDRDDAITGD